MNTIDFVEHKNKREQQSGKRNGWGVGQLFVDLVYDPLDRLLESVVPTSFGIEYTALEAPSAIVVPFGSYSVNTAFGGPR